MTGTFPERLWNVTGNIYHANKQNIFLRVSLCFMNDINIRVVS